MSRINWQQLIKKNTLTHAMLNVFLPNLSSCEREDVKIQMNCFLTLDNPREVVVKIRKLLQCPFIRTSVLPSRKEISDISTTLSEDFRSILCPSRTPTGFRVDLVKYVKFVARHVYDQQSISGLRVDIYGDAMSKGRRDVVRMAFRILDTGSNTEQSSMHVFTFAIFNGKDVRVNLESNLSMSRTLGQKGWLYEQTKMLHEEGVIFSCSGDSPFQLRLLKGVSMNSTLSKMSLYVLDPPEANNLKKGMYVPKSASKTNGGPWSHSSLYSRQFNRETNLSRHCNQC